MPHNPKKVPVQVELTPAEIDGLDRLSGGKFFRATYIRNLLHFAIDNDVRLRPRPIGEDGERR